MEQLIHNYQILESTRSGRIAIGRESIVNTKLFRDDISLSRKRIISTYRDISLRRSYLQKLELENNMDSSIENE